VHQDDRLKFEQKIRATNRKEKDNKVVFTHRLIGANRHEVWVETSVRAIKMGEHPEEHKKRYVASTRDISESMAIEAENKKLLQMTLDLNSELSTQNQELTKAKIELDKFVYRISHDLRSPISSIMGLLNVSKLYDSLSEYRRLTELMEKSANRLDKYIGDILDYSKNSRQELAVEQVDFKKLCLSVYESFDFFERENIEFKLNVQQHIPFFTDINRLGIILKNLISNGLKYRRQDSGFAMLLVEVTTKEESASISVIDNGIGIEPQYHNKVFDIFFRATDRITTGSGLGLYIAKEATDRLKGTITLASVPDKGTTFTLRIPNLKA